MPIFVCKLLFVSLVAQTVKRLSTMRETCVQSLGREDPLEKEMAAHSTILAWRIPWTEEPEICRQNKLIQEKKENLLKLIAEVKDKNQEVEALTANIQDLKEEYARKKETISTANKANEERLKRLQKSADLYKDRLGLEIRKIYGDKLQFIFTDIDPKHPDRPFMFSLCLNEARDYEVSDSAPHLECLAEFQEKVRQTNNFSAFLANVRKAFTALVYN
ncbi:kinetochore protein Spc25 isoform X2 [Ovis aries]|uniref:kinetochore protein Spc25 isoform X2 n=1 Tax=Ovis aries TaxID=9940 RepID=UPI0029526203|nr:kinetochore protein Spc25 isoform X2 [Ovis aries]